METKTKTDNTDRELSTSECKIAIAQIEDRLARIIKAQAEFHSKAIKIKGEDRLKKQDQLEAEVLAKFSIPNKVQLFSQPDNVFGSEQLLILKQYISSFVKGKLTEDQFCHMIFYLSECHAYDYGWIFIERTAAFYMAQIFGSKENDYWCYHTEIYNEALPIGTRSKSKNNKLKLLFVWAKNTD